MLYCSYLQKRKKYNDDFRTALARKAAPGRNNTPRTPQYNDFLDAADVTEKKLLSLLTDEGKELCCKINELRTELCDTENFHIFANGFRMGARLMQEIMENDKKAE